MKPAPNYQRQITNAKLQDTNPAGNSPGTWFSLQVGQQLVKIAAGGAPHMPANPAYEAVPT
jgi:hypothetical protein